MWRYPVARNPACGPVRVLIRICSEERLACAGVPWHDSTPDHRLGADQNARREFRVDSSGRRSSLFEDRTIQRAAHHECRRPSQHEDFLREKCSLERSMVGGCSFVPRSTMIHVYPACFTRMSDMGVEITERVFGRSAITVLTRAGGIVQSCSGPVLCRGKCRCESPSYAKRSWPLTIENGDRCTRRAFPPH